MGSDGADGPTGINPFVFATVEKATPEDAESCLRFLQQQYDACDCR